MRDSSTVKRKRHQVRQRLDGLLRARELARYPWLVHAFTTRQVGNLSFRLGDSFPGDDVTANRQRLLRTLLRVSASSTQPATRPPVGAHAWGDKFRLLTLRQLHSDIVRVVDGPLPQATLEPDGAAELTGDALITKQPGLLLAVKVADCLPILVVDPEQRVVAVAHAGWRGTLARITEKTVGEMRRRFGSMPRHLRAAIGPGIHACCYEVGREVYEAYVAQLAGGERFFRRLEPSPSNVHWNPKVMGRPLKPFGREAAGSAGGSTAGATRWFLDLVAANRAQLRAAGLAPANISHLDFCTACRTDLFFSHRAEDGRTGRQMALIGLVR